MKGVVKKQALLILLAHSLLVSASAGGADNKSTSNVHPESTAATRHAGGNTMKIRITVNSRFLMGTLDDNPTSRDFASLLPMTIVMDDYAGTEKISYLPRKLSRDGAPAGATPSARDIAYYAPWGNLAIYYKDFPYSEGLIRLGAIDDGIEALRAPGTMKVTIERLEK